MKEISKTQQETPKFSPLEYYQRHTTAFWSAIVYGLSIVIFFLYGSLYAAYVDHRISTEKCMPLYAVAHGFGMNLNWNCMLLLVLMLRYTLTYLRNSRLGPYLPFDLAVFAHKTIGWVVGVCVLGHWIFHMIHFRCLANTSNHTYADFLFTTKPGLGWFPPGLASVTGWSLLCAYAVIFVCSLPFVRRSGKFEVFYFTHLLYIPFLIILIVHSNKFWKFIIVPSVVFILEKLSMTRCIRHIMGHKFYIKDITLWTAVSQVKISRPPGFNFNPGEYVFVNIPAIANFEWHPFTISSCPENKDFFTLHIRCAGLWTNKLHAHFKKLSSEPQNVMLNRNGLSAENSAVEVQQSIFCKQDALTRGSRIVPATEIRVYIHGTFGSPSGQIFHAQHAVLICAGIGVTPFASILQSILYRHRASLEPCPAYKRLLDYYQVTAPTVNRFTLRKVNFIWVVNNQKSIEWFLELLEHIDTEQRAEPALGNLIDIQIYVTGAKKMGEHELYTFALTRALDLVYEKHGRDLISGVRARPIPGRPDWTKVFQQIEQTKRGAVSVFYCGPLTLSAELKKKCHDFGFRYSKESF